MVRFIVGNLIKTGGRLLRVAYKYGMGYLYCILTFELSKEQCVNKWAGFTLALFFLYMS